MVLTTADCLTVLVPTNEVETARAELAPRPRSLAGLRVGVLDNGKPNSDRLLEIVTASLVSLLGIDVNRRLRKPFIGRLAPDEMVDDLATGCDVVITGVGDCAGCCSCTVADAVALEQRGVPAAAICTSEFAAAAALAAASAGAPGYEFAVIPHPLGSCTDDDLAERAAVVVDRVSRLLTAGAEMTGGHDA